MMKRATSSCLGAGSGVAAFMQENLVTARWETVRQAVKTGRLAAPKDERK
jgi:hypothetical protein